MRAHICVGIAESRILMSTDLICLRWASITWQIIVRSSPTSIMHLIKKGTSSQASEAKKSPSFNLL